MLLDVNRYLKNKESVLFWWEIGEKGIIDTYTGKKTKVNVLGITNKRVFHFKKLKGYDRIYRDIPLKKISYIENTWHARNRLFLILGAIFLIVGIGLCSTTIVPTIIVGVILIIIGIILLVKGLKQYGYLMINGDDWKFHFNRRKDIGKIEEFIQEVYFIKSEV